ncbi:MAG: 4Fe-4S dicluster domain-containing protein, partial [Candidatus Zixiibacteriota bacterium]
STYSLTGSVADHRLRVASKSIASVAAALAMELRNQGLNLPVAASLSGGGHDIDAKWLRVAASDLMKARGKSLVCAGYRQPAAVHALVVAINEALGNVGTAVNYVDPVDAQLPSRQGLALLTQKISAGQISTLLIIGGNPVFNAPADVNFTTALAKVENTINLSLYRDETAHKVNWHLPMAHYLESWSDARSSDGTASVVQPMIEPLFGGHSAVELLTLVLTGEDKRGYDVVRQTWNTMVPGAFEKGWRKVLHDGLLDGSAAPSAAISTDAGSIAAAISALEIGNNGLEVVFAASPQLHDGRFANNGWLMEQPHPITKITWDNVAMVSIATAKQLGLKSGELVELSVGGRKLELPVWLVPGHADNSVTVELGYGRTLSGRVGDKVGFDTYVLRGSDAPDIATGAVITKLGREYSISSAQDHGSMEGRPLVREANLEDYRKDPNFAQEMVEHPPLESLWDEPDYSKGNQWGMSVDLNTCTGCGACTLACQSENNIPIVGKAQVAKGREMHWLRIDRYFSGEIEDAEMVHQPVMCQHCENAPCEQVCPVAATVHDKEGLNVMVYNRCIGTRYCSNNCPYKVRRFNYFNFTKDTPEIVKMAMNPDVTVRFRGVMEKCTFCVQRISEARIKSKLESREIRDGDITTACQQACPTKALTFGNINDPNSQVRKVKSQNRNYTMLAELNVKPRLTYLARIRNPHPDLTASTGAERHG